jgi:hypothetical protein
LAELLSAPRIELLVPCSPWELAEKLRPLIGDDTTWWSQFRASFGPRDVIGHVEGASLVLRKRRTNRNQAPVALRAELRPDAGGTLISGRVAQSAAMTGVTSLAFAGIALVLASDQRRGFEAFRSQPLWLGGVVLAMLTVYAVSHRISARRQASFLREFLIHELGAMPYQSPYSQ